MKNLLIFLFGAAAGACGMLVWLRKGIKQELEKQAEAKEDLPFTVSDEDKKEEIPVNIEEHTIDPETRVQYHNIVNEVKNNVVEDPDEAFDQNPTDGYFVESDEKAGLFVEIDDEEYLHNHDYEKEKLVYFRGDHIMCNENGTIYPPYQLVGDDWENYVGNHAFNTAFIRNNRLLTDYEIYVEDGLYEDEYGNDMDFIKD